MKIGVMAESFRLPFPEAVAKAAELGADGLQVYATHGWLKYDEMTKDKIRETLDIVHSHGLVFSALCGDFGGHGFMDPEENKWKIDASKRIVDLSNELGCSIVTTHIGTVPSGELSDEQKKTYEIMQTACRDLAVYADSVNAAFAVETGPETAKVLGDFLDSLGAMGVRVNFDPANLVMCVGDRPETAVHELAKYIVHTHAKDGRMLPGGKHIELPLGEGDVNFDTYIPNLAKTGFDGFLTIEREVGGNPAADIAMAADFLRALKAKYNV
ncbi:MAG: sugar phosphate isomerase/epimerase [Ruminococcaceae bacterium]|nr:sugar phosphate isomerase/epimerase [Oscillospiraceae bacterium]